MTPDSTSKFGTLLQKRQPETKPETISAEAPAAAATAPEVEVAAQVPTPASSPRRPRQTAAAKAIAAPAQAEGARQRGRPAENGKSSDPDFRQTSIILRIQTLKKVKGILLDTDDERDVSDLVEELLAGWVKRQ